MLNELNFPGPGDLYPIDEKPGYTGWLTTSMAICDGSADVVVTRYYEDGVSDEDKQEVVWKGVDVTPLLNGLHDMEIDAYFSENFDAIVRWKEVV